MLILIRRELAAYFHAPIAYVVGVFFLLSQGITFWSVVEALSDPSSPAPWGAALSTHFGGTLWYWAGVFLLVSVITMRSIAEERQQGTWETLLTVPISESAVVIGKWIAATLFFAGLWLPTLAYPVLVALFSSTSIDPGPVVSAYLAVVVTGGAFTAVGVAVSAATRNQVIAAAATFVLLAVLLLLGQLGAGEAGHDRGIQSVFDLRTSMESFARGAVSTPLIALTLALTLVSFGAARVGVAVGRRRRHVVVSRLIAAVLMLVIGFEVVVLVVGNATTWDLSRARVNSLEEETLSMLRRVRAPVDILRVQPTASEVGALYREVDGVLGRMIEVQPMLREEGLNLLDAPHKVEELARQYGLAPTDLSEGGAVVFRVGGRTRVVDLLDMATLSSDALGSWTVSRFRAEEAFTAAIRDVIAEDSPVLCFATGHGERSPGGDDPLRVAFDRLAREGYTFDTIGDLEIGVPPRCRVVLVISPDRDMSAREQQALVQYLESGGRLFVAAPDDPGRPTGLAMVLADVGLAVGNAVVMDPRREIDVPLTWMVVTDYGDHSIVRGFEGRRRTLWQAPRPVLSGEAPDHVERHPLIRSSATGWAEQDLQAIRAGRPVSADEGEAMGGVPVATAATDRRSGGRVVVVGGTRALVLGAAAGSANTEFFVRSLDWLAGRDEPFELADKTPETVRLLVTKAELNGIFAACVVVLPGLWAALGALLWWRRRRD